MSAPGETVLEDLRNALQLLEPIRNMLPNDGRDDPAYHCALAAIPRIESAIAKLAAQSLELACPRRIQESRLPSPMAVAGDVAICIWCGYVHELEHALEERTAAVPA